MSETIRRAFRRTGRGKTDTTLIVHQPGVRVDWYTVTTRDRNGEFTSAHHEWFDSTGAHGPQYMTQDQLPEHLRGQISSPERIDEQYENMVAGLLRVKHGRPSEEIPLSEIGDVEAHIRQASRRQVVLDDDAAEAAVERLSGSGTYHHD